MSDLKARTKNFALRIVRMYSSLPKSTEAQVMGKQVLRSGTSVAANYREACRARSPAEFRSKLGIVEQELDETLLWLELLVESGIVAEAKMSDILKETDELLRIIVSSITTSKKGRKNGKQDDKEFENSAFCIPRSAFEYGDRHHRKPRTQRH